MRGAASGPHAERLRALIVIMWRAGLRISETLALAESDLDAERGSLVVRHGKGDKRREVGMDDWGWQQLAAWRAARLELPIGSLLCVINGPGRGGRGPLLPLERAFALPRLARACPVASLHTSCATRTPSRWHAKEFR